MWVCKDTFETISIRAKPWNLDSGHSKSDNGLKFYKAMRLEPNGPETECKLLVYCATLLAVECRTNAFTF